MTGANAANAGQGKPLTILGHLAELRIRLIRSVIAVLITSVLAFIFYKPIFDILVRPAGNYQFIAIEMTERLGVIFRVALMGGIMAAIPYLTYELIMFVSPALTAREKKYVYLILPWIALMFAGGVVFGYFILIPPAIRFLMNYGSDIAITQIRISNYITLVTRLLLSIGLIFEMPVVTTFLARIGIIDSRWLARKRKAAIIIAFVVAAIMTPTFDPFNQTLVALPLIVLYEMSIWLAVVFGKKKRTEEV
jgi:sec-independent protein translocase protein TatC